MLPAKTTMRWSLIVFGFWSVPVLRGLGRFFVAGPNNSLVQNFGAAVDSDLPT